MKLSQIHPFFYHARIKQKQVVRHLADFFSRRRFAKTYFRETYPFVCKKHQSLLRRKLGSSDPRLQENKIVNLRLALKQVDGILVRPGETFSFWHLVGKTTAKKGYIEGLLLSQGEVKTGIGGGLCQMANMLYWLALHTPLQVCERHHHHFDPFPDDQRALPFGSGASVFYNYVDLRFYNPTQQTFQIRLWITDKHLRGAVYSDKPWGFSYHVEERQHCFSRDQERVYRENEIWRQVIDKSNGNRVSEELVMRNFSEVKYEVDERLISHSFDRS